MIRPLPPDASQVPGGRGSLGGWTLEEGKPCLKVPWARDQEEERRSTIGVLYGPPQAHLSHRKLPSSTLGHSAATLSAWGLSKRCVLQLILPRESTTSSLIQLNPETHIIQQVLSHHFVDGNPKILRFIKQD